MNSAVDVNSLPQKIILSQSSANNPHPTKIVWHHLSNYYIKGKSADYIVFAPADGRGVVCLQSGWKKKDMDNDDNNFIVEVMVSVITYVMVVLIRCLVGCLGFMAYQSL